MRSVERVIAQAIVYDHNPTDGAKRIVAALDAAGFEIRRKPEPDEPARVIAFPDRVERIPSTRQMYG